MANSVHSEQSETSAQPSKKSFSGQALKATKRKLTTPVSTFIKAIQPGKKHKTNTAHSDRESDGGASHKTNADHSDGESDGGASPVASVSTMPVSTAPPKKSMQAMVIDITDEEDEDEIMEIEVEHKNEAMAEEDMGRRLHLMPG